MEHIGLFGGTFDPVHNGHLQCASAALLEGGMDRIIFIPCAQPPHKNGHTICHFDHRLAMLEMAIQETEYFSVTDLEKQYSTPSYTVDTLDYFQEKTGSGISFHFIIGCDAFVEIESWHRWREVLRKTNFIIVTRPGYDFSNLHTILTRNRFKSNDVHQKIWRAPAGQKKVRLLSSQTEDISSTIIKGLIRENKNWKPLLPVSVGKYIDHHSLYR